MKVEQIYTGCLAQGAYYIESDGEAAVIDPLREINPYLRKAEEDGARIKYVLETHFHADFVSGHIDLANESGATIVFGPNARPNFPFYSAADGEELQVGKVKLRVLHTPGHTMESTCYLLLDETGKPHAIFTGDTLFLGDVGRPDLAAKSDLTEAQLAGHLYDSLRTKIMTLPDDVIVYPGHGAGSACGKNMRKETVGSIGGEKATNYALRADMTREEFVKEVTAGLAPPPAYFPQNVAMNKHGYDSIHTVLKRGLQALSPDDFEAAANETGALVLDTRNPDNFANGFIPNSINIGLDGNFAPWVGALITDVKQPLLIVAEPGREEETVTRLARVGYDYALGYLNGGFEAWHAAGKECDSIENISAETFKDLLSKGKIRVVDVRKPSEHISEHIPGSINLPLDYINEHMASFSHTETQYLHCAGGYRSMIAASILKARGYEHVVNVKGGFKAIKEAGITVSNYLCPSIIQSS
jgi:glyoxylase-like metal-dependent hydrolase (beta-lactamase superfamily II)/rhodanese-related sulfurtransferase